MLFIKQYLIQTNLQYELMDELHDEKTNAH
jgi:hypothetical protein